MAGRLMRLATYSSDGRPLDLADIATFIAALAEAGIPASTPALFETTGGESTPQPATAISVIVTESQAAALPDDLEITDAPEIEALQEV